MHEFTVRTSIEADQELVFDAARDMDLHKKSQSQFNEKIIDGVAEGLIGLDQSVSFKASHFGIPFKLTSQVTEFDSPNRFVDEQVSGPFKSFYHEHLFKKSDHGTLMIDRIEFAAPLGPIGNLVTNLLLQRYMRALISKRGMFLKAEVETAEQR